MNFNIIFTYLVIAVVTFIVAYMLGLTIINTVDKRLTEISINMPEIKIPQNKLTLSGDGPVYYKVEPKVKKIQVLDLPAGKVDQNEQIGGSDSSANPSTKVSELGKRVCKNKPTRKFNSKQYRSESKTVKPPKPQRKPDLHPHRKSLPVAYPNDTEQDRDLTEKSLAKTQDSGSGQLVPTYYRDPKDMTLAEQIKFRNRAKIRRMTAKDYENWLMMFKEDPQNLTKVHRDRLRRVLKGDRLQAADIPDDSVKEIPPNAETRYNKKFKGQLTRVVEMETGTEGDEDSTHQIHAANYSDFDHYIPPKSLKHLSHFNPDETKKSGNKFLDAIRPKPSKLEEKAEMIENSERFIYNKATAEEVSESTQDAIKEHAKKRRRGTRKARKGRY